MKSSCIYETRASFQPSDKRTATVTKPQAGSFTFLAFDRVLSLIPGRLRFIRIGAAVAERLMDRTSRSKQVKESYVVLPHAKNC